MWMIGSRNTFSRFASHLIMLLPLADNHLQAVFGEGIIKACPRLYGIRWVCRFRLQKDNKRESDNTATGLHHLNLDCCFAAIRALYTWRPPWSLVKGMNCNVVCSLGVKGENREKLMSHKRRVHAFSDSDTPSAIFRFTMQSCPYIYSSLKSCCELEHCSWEHYDCFCHKWYLCIALYYVRVGAIMMHACQHNEYDKNRNGPLCTFSFILSFWLTGRSSSITSALVF